MKQVKVFQVSHVSLLLQENIKQRIIRIKSFKNIYKLINLLHQN